LARPVGTDGLKLLIFVAPRARDRMHASYELVASGMLIMAGGHDIKPVGSRRIEASNHWAARASSTVVTVTQTAEPTAWQPVNIGGGRAAEGERDD
jgi:hypothetical protein